MHPRNFTPPHGSPALQRGEEGESTPKGYSPQPRALARGAGFTWCFAVMALSCGLISSLVAAGEMSQDELRMKEQLTALSQGAGAVADLRIELMDGTMASSRHYEIVHGKIVKQAWDSPGVPGKHEERTVTDDEVRNLLRELVEKQYWTFRGTRFIPDANTFLFRFYYKDLQPVDYRCDVDESERFPQRSAIRAAFLNFVSGNAKQAATPIAR